MKNIHLIPTDKLSRLYEFGGEYHLQIKSQENFRSQHIYITNDEEIKEGDWCYYENGDLKGIHKVVNGQRPKTMILKKIILTTDNKDLIKDGVQAIDDTFLEWFVKNPSCERVEIRDYKLHFGSTIYKIIIPQEEPKQSNNFYEELKHYFETTPREKVLEDWNKSAEFDKIGPTVEEFLGMIQETLEEAAEKQWGKLAIINDRAAVIAFKAGAKWQAERMYSEEDMHKAYCAGSDFDMSCLKDEQYYMFKKWFEQYKKK
jgi:hypothetical protein